MFARFDGFWADGPGRERLSMNWRRVVAGAIPALFVLSCGGEGGTPDEGGNNGATFNGGKGDFSAPLVCDVESATGRDPSTLRDPVAAFLMRGGDCPSSHEELIEKFQKAHLKGEGEDATECDRALESYVVSETAQIQGTPNGSGYRVVVSRQCGETDRHELLWSLFGVRPTKENPEAKPEDWRLPNAGIEFMAYDESAGVYNYYEFNGRGFDFFGDSADIENHQAGRCQECHVGGGMVMKELDTPWVHWEGHEDIPGAKELVSGNEKLLGFKGTGSTFESITKRGNEQYNERRAERLMLEGTTQQLLRPLFCTVEVNLDNATDFKDREVTRIPGDFFLDRQFTSFSRNVDMDHAAYQKILDETGSRVEGVSGEFDDTIFRFTFPERAHIDDDYVETLVEKKLIDEDFMRDVLMVDFTRPIFSEARCSLLSFAPEIDFLVGLQQANNGVGEEADAGTSDGGASSGSSTPDFAGAIRQGFIDNLTAASPAEGTAEAELLAALQNVEDQSTHDERVNGFIEACKARNKEDMMRDIARVNSVYRGLARRTPVFEFPQTMPFSNLNEPTSLKFNADTCVAE